MATLLTPSLRSSASSWESPDLVAGVGVEEQVDARLVGTAGAPATARGWEPGRGVATGAVAGSRGVDPGIGVPAVVAAPQALSSSAPAPMARRPSRLGDLNVPRPPRLDGRSGLGRRIRLAVFMTIRELRRAAPRVDDTERSASGHAAGALDDRRRSASGHRREPSAAAADVRGPELADTIAALGAPGAGPGRPGAFHHAGRHVG